MVKNRVKNLKKKNLSKVYKEKDYAKDNFGSKE